MALPLPLSGIWFVFLFLVIFHADSLFSSGVLAAQTEVILLTVPSTLFALYVAFVSLSQTPPYLPSPASSAPCVMSIVSLICHIAFMDFPHFFHIVVHFHPGILGY